jgi:hypothetical protein
MRFDCKLASQKPVRLIALIAPSAVVMTIAILLMSAAQANGPQEPKSLLQILGEWKYPGSTMLDGASMSDGGNPLVQSVKCKSILTTPDPIDKVIAFYTKKLVPPPAAAVDLASAAATSVSTQEDSQDRPLTLKVFVVNTVDTSTTLVISRAVDEKETHISWQHYFRVDGKRQE